MSNALTLLLARRVDLKTVSAVLGHSTISPTANTYAAVLPSLASDAMTRLGALLTTDGPQLREQDVSTGRIQPQVGAKKAYLDLDLLEVTPGIEPGVVVLQVGHVCS